MIKTGNTVLVAAPESKHAHMKGQNGRVVEVKVNKTTRRWEARVNFVGGAGWFGVDELEPMEKRENA